MPVTPEAKESLRGLIGAAMLAMEAPNLVNFVSAIEFMWKHTMDLTNPEELPWREE